MLKSRQKSRKWQNNGRLKEKILIKKPFKTQSIEQRPEMLIQLNSKEWMRLNLFGSDKDQELKSNNISNFTRMSLEIVVIHIHGHTLKLKEMLISQDLSLFQKEHPMINSINSMRRNQKLSFTLEEFWSTINLKNFFLNTWTSLRLLLTQIISHSMWTDKTYNTIRH